MINDYEGRAKFEWISGEVWRADADGKTKPVLRIIVSGSPAFRDLRMLRHDDEALIKPLTKNHTIEIVTTGGVGCDEMIQQWAIGEGYLVSQFSPCWDEHKKKAPDVRNKAMIEYSLEPSLQTLGIVYIVNESRAARHVFNAINDSKMLCVHRTLEWAERVLVYPSSIDGDCSSGLAKAALSWGASPKVVSGASGQSYALTMRDQDRSLMPFTVFAHQVSKLIRHASDNPYTQFLYNRVGCRSHEYEQDDVARLFEGAPPNIFIINAQGELICLAAQWESMISLC